jgi:hypothetical protein
MAHDHEAGAAGKNDDTINIEVNSADADATFTVSKTTKVSELISMAVAKFVLDPNDVYSLALPGKTGEPLQGDRPLVSYHLQDGARVLLTSKAGGV